MRKIKVTNRQRINASSQKILDTILNCRAWSKFLPGVKKIEVIEEKGNYTRRILHSEINKMIVKMETETFYIPEKKTIKYIQIQTPWPLKSNCGIWKVKDLSSTQVELTLTHVFEMKYFFWGYLLGVLVIKPFFIYRHNKKDLKLYKNYIENGVQNKNKHLY